MKAFKRSFQMLQNQDASMSAGSPGNFDRLSHFSPELFW